MPLKGGGGNRLFAVNPLAIILDDQKQYFEGDLRQLVHEAFWKHGKDIADSARAKLQNTEQFLRACRFAFKNKEVVQRMTLLEEKPTSTGDGPSATPTDNESDPSHG